MLDLDSEMPEYFGGASDVSFPARFENILERNGIEHRRVRYNRDFWPEMKQTSHFIARPKGIEPDLMIMEAILPQLEAMDIACLPGRDTFRMTGDKLRLAAFFEAQKIASPQTDALFSEADVERWIVDWGVFPIVAKLRKGAGSINVTLLNEEAELRRLARDLFADRIREGDLSKSYGKRMPERGSLFRRTARKILGRETRGVPIIGECLLLQHFLPGNSHDLRVTTIGSRAFTFRRKTRQGDFRASGSGMIEYNPSEMRMDCVQMAQDISKRFNFQTMAYDFLFDEAGLPQILEMNYTYVAKAVSMCPGFFDAGGNFVEHDNHSPQYYQLVDFLQDKNLRA
ncbi:ATP-grasp domain-containing protein [Alteripontixanthobacter maritimus]|uniref:ATP-grasp domain-containing protein n=1 Tax=Alteripontixanthobacter maritimus TaxID=2161824 RepID=UPI0011C043D1|nr:hypothetical protein [Alteripontixanthobacter maritimus]